MRVPEARAWWQTMERSAKDGEHGFDSFGTEWRAPSVFRYVGGTEPNAYDKAK